MTVFVVRMATYFHKFTAIAETEAELFALTDRIGAARKGSNDYHFYLTRTQRALAIRHGAVELSLFALWSMINARRKARGYVHPKHSGSGAIAGPGPNIVIQRSTLPNSAVSNAGTAGAVR
jgi:hypothetical protein